MFTERISSHSYSNIHRLLFYFWFLFSGRVIVLVLVVLSTAAILDSCIVVFAYLPLTYFLFLVPGSFSFIFIPTQILWWRIVIRVRVIVIYPLIGPTDGIRVCLPRQGLFAPYVPILFLATLFSQLFPSSMYLLLGRNFSLRLLDCPPKKKFG